MSGFTEDDAFEAAAVPLSQRAMVRPGAAYLDGLNPAQREAVETLNGPVLMLAGAGTGKTKALTTRITHLLATGTARPHEILAVTFTNKAAREMKNRIGGLMGEAVEGMPWLGTFHSVCAKQLRRHAELVGLKSNFTILDTDDQIRLMKQLIEAAGIDHKRWPARMLSGIIDGWKNKALTPDKIPVAESGAFDHKGVELYAAYQRRLLDLNAVDFGDILLHMVTIFQKHEDVLQQYQRWFRYILVDEYQDTNVAQYMWLRLLAASHKNICCVGDDDQSIYGWRGAEVGNILRFEKDFPGAHVVRLEENYRSTGHILAAASGVISANKGRLGKTLFTNGEDGEKVRLIGHWDGEEEARWIGEEVEAMQRGTRGMAPMGLDDLAILVRASHQMRAFEDRFLTIGLPYRVIGGPRFYERMEIRDAMAYFRLAVSPEDDLAFERIVNTPKRGLGDKAVQTIQRTARSNGVSLVEGARLVCQGKLLGGKGLKELTILVAGLDRWHGQVRAEADTHVELAEMILDESGYTGFWQNDKTPEAPGRLENLKELVKALENFENLQGFLEHVSLIMDNETEEQGEKVSIMTLHAAKGLEFPAVFLPGWEDGLFPSQRSMDESGMNGLEEERRLAYVGITRAEEICTVSFAANRRVYGQWQSAMPSRFIDELPQDHVEVLTPPGLYGGGYGAAGMSASASPAMAGMVGSDLHEKAHKADVYNSPGWKRLQSRSQQRGMSMPSEARNMTIDMDAVSGFTEGERVFHQKFGYGEVMGIEGDKLVIEFDKAGSKHVVARFIVSADKADDVPF
ncbi:UvrD-helicase domain-containing protein [Yoonia sp. F2084L]|uniref:ATP-dependent helicase n=1 Tax=Yoonia sp. F2084L TaxID=2926419 RepID=UPI001FF26946|nr:UvrD-helicase domain-containing protein [Yoonia sp. F2084L]MCK0096224.1 UvrD-helicase domain-containing protein [Yoonia sp. F2084L]